MTECREVKRVPLKRWFSFYIFSADWHSLIKSIWLFNCILITWSYDPAWGKIEDLDVAWRPGGE